MFGASPANPYDDIVAKTTDEHLTSENWELILNLCDKVADSSDPGSAAHDVIASLLKRLAHRNPNVQLYALSVAEALGKNCGVEVHRELASRAWTGGVERVVTDRNTHTRVRTRALALVAQWTADFADDPTLGIMQECYEGLKAKNYTYTPPDDPAPPAVDDAIRRREEEELQRVLEMSVKDRGGRQPYPFEADTGNGAGSSSAAGGGGYAGGSSGGYVPAQRDTQRERSPSPVQTADPTPSASAAATTGIVTRVRALHPFAPTEPGELGFERGDVIKVVDRGYKDWWRGQLKGRTGIFPVNYVEPLPEPTPAELAAEASQEAAVFAQAVNVEKLLNMLRALDPGKGDNLAEDEEIQELYRSCMALRPKIVKLIDKYSQKRADLVSMNETFVRARTIFDRMMEESLARHSGYAAQAQQQGAWGGYPDAAAYAYAQAQQGQQGQGQAAYGVYGPQGPTPYPAQQQQQGGGGAYPGQQGYQQPQPAQQQGYPAQAQQQQQQQGPTPYPAQQQQQQSQGYPAQQAQAQPTPYQQPAQQAQAQPIQQQQQPQQQPQPAQQQQPAAQQPVVEQQPQPQPEPQQAQQQQAQQQATTQQQQVQQQIQQQQQQGGPPYVYDPATTYADPNVQAWAQYYAAGGTDAAGSVYFISVPGITDTPPPAQAAPAQAVQEQQQQPIQQQQQQPAQQQQPVQQQQPAPAQQVQPQPQLQHQNSIGSVSSLTSPIDDDDDPGYLPDPYANQLPDPYANQPEYANAPAQQPQQAYPNPHAGPTSPGGSGSELAHALGPQGQGQGQYGGYGLADPGSPGGSSGFAQPQIQRQGFSLTDPGSAAAVPGSPVAEASGTPSWVLPKKSPNPNARGAGGGGAGIAGQFAGMQV
ncbi:hypothetical protein R3P38DRAFT_3313840 [Favolaschia claudopus]|uniref:Class E vacuolar protein-sorting machinery protein HSE1 n=1 Tax=Favolaschia claudopus TaxID=2862362 RepID=A0AAW0BZH1_9AGAR